MTPASEFAPESCRSSRRNASNTSLAIRTFELVRAGTKPQPIEMVWRVKGRENGVNLCKSTLQRSVGIEKEGHFAGDRPTVADHNGAGIAAACLKPGYRTSR